MKKVQLGFFRKLHHSNAKNGITLYTEILLSQKETKIHQ